MIQDKILRAKIGIVLEQPFFATLLMRKKFVADSSVKTAVTNGAVIRYNEQFFESLSAEELKGVICKQIMHTALLHPFRREGRDQDKWKQACDPAAAQFLHNAGMVLPQALTKPQYDNMSAEDIYRMLPENKDKDDSKGDGQNNDPGGCGTFEDAPAETREQQEAEAKQELAQAMQVAKQQGSIPAGLDLLMEILEPKVPWKEVLSRFIVEQARNDYSFSRPNPRYLQSGFILPSLYNLEVGEIVLAADTSLSMDEDELNRVASEIHDVASSFAAHITVIYCDTKVAGTQDIEPNDDFKLEPKGGGGTDFRPPFEWLSENGMVPKCLIYFTDGQCDDFPEEPDYPVLWAVTGSKFEPPFGEVIYID